MLAPRASSRPRTIRSEMPELAGVPDDAHGLDAALDDIHGEDVPDPELGLALGNHRGGSASAGELAPHDRGELVGVDVTSLQERQRLLDRAPLGLPKLLLARASQQAAGLAVDPHQPALK